jgi:hypothetical protein
VHVHGTNELFRIYESPGSVGAEIAAVAGVDVCGATFSCVIGLRRIILGSLSNDIGFPSGPLGTVCTSPEVNGINIFPPGLVDDMIPVQFTVEQ